MSCSCKLKSGPRKGQRCGAPTKGQFCARHTKCMDFDQQSPSSNERKIEDLRQKIAYAEEQHILFVSKIEDMITDLQNASNVAKLISMGLKKGDLYWTDLYREHIPHKTMLKKLTASQWKQFYDEFMLNSDVPFKNKEEIFAFLEEEGTNAYASLPTIKSSRMYLLKL